MNITGKKLSYVSSQAGACYKQVKRDLKKTCKSLVRAHLKRELLKDVKNI